MTERWLSVKEIAAHLGVSKETIYNWIEEKTIPAHKIGRFWKFKASQVDAWVTNEQTSSIKTENCTINPTLSISRV
jgi:excisionase family DNA binding protein